MITHGEMQARLFKAENRVHELLKQRDELLAALKAVDSALRTAWAAGNLPDSAVPAPFAQKCKDAIKNATEVQP